MDALTAEILESSKVGIAGKLSKKDKSLRPNSSVQPIDGHTDSLKNVRGSTRKGVIPANQHVLSVSGTVLASGKPLTETKRRPYSASPTVPTSDNQLILHYDSQLLESVEPSVIESCRQELSDDLNSLESTSVIDTTFADHVHSIRPSSSPLTKFQPTGRALRISKYLRSHI